MSALHESPAQGAAAQPVTDPQFVAGVAPGGDVHQARPPVRRRGTWMLSLVAGLGKRGRNGAQIRIRRRLVLVIRPVSPFRHQCPRGNLRSHRVVAVQQLSGSEKSVLRPPAQRVAVDHPRGAVLGVHV